MYFRKLLEIFENPLDIFEKIFSEINKKIDELCKLNNKK